MVFVLLLGMILYTLYVLKRNKTYNVRWISFIYILMVIIILSARNLPDSDNYKMLYYNKDWIGSDIGFTIISHMFCGFGIDYLSFQHIYQIFALSGLFVGMSLLENKSFFLWFLFFLYPFPLNLIQIRMFLVEVFLVQAIVRMSKPGIMNRIMGIIIICTASSQHVSALAYLPFVFFLCLKEKLKNSLSLFFALLSLVFWLICIHSLEINRIVFSALKLMRFGGRYTDYKIISNFYGSILMSAISIALILATRTAICLVKDNQKCISNYSYFGCVYDLLRYSVVFWPLFIVHGNFFRLIQCEYILATYVIMNCLKIYRKKYFLNQMRWDVRCLICVAMLIFVYAYGIYVVWVDNSGYIIKSVLG